MSGIKNGEMFATFRRDGNIKLGNIAEWATTQGDEEMEINYNGFHAMVKGTCEGRCDGCKKACYVNKATNRYQSVRYGYAINTLLMRENIEKLYTMLRNQIARAKKPFEIIRIHVSGEFEQGVNGLNEWKMFERLASDFPNITFYTYTKAYEIAIPRLLAGNVPSNMIVNISVWENQGIKEFDTVKHLPNVKAYVYYDRKNRFDYLGNGIKFDAWCKAYDIHGKMDHDITCDKCRKCFDNHSKCIGCFDH